MQAIPSAGDLLRVTESGLYCERGDFYVDPWRRVPRAIITHEFPLEQWEDAFEAVENLTALKAVLIP